MTIMQVGAAILNFIILGFVIYGFVVLIKFIRRIIKALDIIEKNNKHKIDEN
ncbi:hypothetical protein ACFIJ5_14345 [Haloimpatiens sp. FM7330]|uniref:hypothetical protein n=1 Tax=Haloimpatiens sp. FM7330 TaxID=3298610 RepID=UPI003633719A